MQSFAAIFNVMLIAVILYQALYFLVQYAVMKKAELFYYSMFLLCLGIYYYAYVLTDILHLDLKPVIQTAFTAVKMPFQFFVHVFYIIFIIYYLELQKTRQSIYRLCNYFKYFNLFFTIVFLVPDLLGIESNYLFHVVTFLLLIFTLVMLIKLWRINTIYSKVILYGTACNVIGICGTHVLVVNGTNIDAPDATAYLPLQISQLFDVFILGYGLSLKTADADRKLVKALQEKQKLLEVERSRLAKDLHDGLGGLLSGIKLTLGSIPGNMILSEKNAAIFTRALSQLDNTIAEMRRVAHSMMPEALLRFGLSEAIRDFCDGINESDRVKMKFTQIGLPLRLDQSTEVTFYRIIQELTNNAIKHAAAKNIFIQLNRHEQGTTITVEDDGKGFDIGGMTKGAGLKNVQSRLDYLKGTMEINSRAGEGSTFNIEIPL